MDIHSARLNAVLSAASTVAHGARLTLTSIGRNLPNRTSQKHRIKSIDQLLSNGHLYGEKKIFYTEIAKRIIGKQNEIFIIVDWSPCPNKDNHVLRASLLTKEGSSVLYQEVHPESKQCNHKVQTKFLSSLQEILPPNLHVTLVTDAGFKTNWFMEVKRRGWDFVGRVRGRVCYQKDNKWEKCYELYKKAKNMALDIGHVLLARSIRFECRLVLFKEKFKPKKNLKRKKKNLKGRMEKKYRKSYFDPWLLATSHEKLSPKLIVKIYRKRMKIEGTFRNTKNSKWGIGFRDSLTRNPIRLSILLLIGAIATFILWLIGMTTELKCEHYKYQANTIKHKRVISLIRLGLSVIKENEAITISELKSAIVASHMHENIFDFGSFEMTNF